MKAVAAAKSAGEPAVKRGAGTASESTIVAAVAGPAQSVIGPPIGAPVIGPRPAVVTAPLVAMEPRAGADENAVHKPVRTVVAVRSATIRVVAVVAVGAIRRARSGCKNRTNSHADRDAHLSR